MDRIYASDANTQMFKNYAQKSGWFYKSCQDARDDWFCNPKCDAPIEQSFRVPLDHWEFEHYPYMDTFRFLDTSTGELTNYVYKTSKHWVSLYGTEGYSTTDDLTWSDYHEGYILSTKAVHVPNTGYVWLEDAWQDTSGRWRLIAELVTLVDGSKYPKTESMHLKGLGWVKSSEKPKYRYVKDRKRYYPMDEIILVARSRTYIHCEDAVTLHNGLISHRKNAVYIENQAVFIPISSHPSNGLVEHFRQSCAVA